MSELATVEGNDFQEENPRPFKLNIKRTIWIAIAFFGILLVWGVYNSYCSSFLTFQFAGLLGLKYETLNLPANASDYLQVQWLVGIVMALDNVAALFLMPIFGRLSDRTHTRIGKRMPFIIVGTVVTAIALPFIPIFFNLTIANSNSSDNTFLYGGTIGVVAMMVIVLVFMMMYRSPAVALMPDLTPKPLRNKANGIINIVGYLGGAVAVFFGMFLPFSSYINSNDHNFWYIEIPFLVASIVLLISLGLLLWKVRENKIAEDMKEEMARGDALTETEEEVSDDTPLSPVNKRNFILILLAEFLWFMSFNAIETFLAQYVMFYLNCSTSFKSYLELLSGVASCIVFIFAGSIADKIGRKRTILAGLAIVTVCYLAMCFAPSAMAIGNMAEGDVYDWADSLFTAPIAYILIFAIGFTIVGAGSSLIHCNSLPLVLDFCNSKKIGTYTSIYYAASMAAQSVTPIAIGAILSLTSMSIGDSDPSSQMDLWRALPIYSCCLMAAALIVFFFVHAPKAGDRTPSKKGLEALGDAD